MSQSTANDPLDARRRRGVRWTVIATVAFALLVYIGILSGVIGR